jgi:hypothetical protein
MQHVPYLGLEEMGTTPDALRDDPGECPAAEAFKAACHVLHPGAE